MNRRRAIVSARSKTLTAHCARCNHEWARRFAVPITLEQTATLLESVASAGCPACAAGADAVLCGPAPRRAQEVA